MCSSHEMYQAPTWCVPLRVHQQCKRSDQSSLEQTIITTSLSHVQMELINSETSGAATCTHRQEMCSLPHTWVIDNSSMDRSGSLRCATMPSKEGMTAAHRLDASLPPASQAGTIAETAAAAMAWLWESSPPMLDTLTRAMTCDRGETRELGQPMLPKKFFFSPVRTAVEGVF